jgi:hypothetical protein
MCWDTPLPVDPIELIYWIPKVIGGSYNQPQIIIARNVSSGSANAESIVSCHEVGRRRSNGHHWLSEISYERGHPWADTRQESYDSYTKAYLVRRRPLILFWLIHSLLLRLIHNLLRNFAFPPLWAGK